MQILNVLAAVSVLAEQRGLAALAARLDAAAGSLERTAKVDVGQALARLEREGAVQLLASAMLKSIIDGAAAELRNFTVNARNRLPGSVINELDAAVSRAVAGQKSFDERDKGEVQRALYQAAARVALDNLKRAG